MAINKKNDYIKNLIEAHSWLGLVISLFLFLVFWAGAVTLFYPEIDSWAQAPHHPVDLRAEDIPAGQIIEQQLRLHPHDSSKTLRISLPSEHSPYYRFRITSPTPDKERLRLKVNPKTGEAVMVTTSGAAPFFLANFMYRLHYNLNLSRFGTYFIGMVSLVFFFAIFSGLVIHAKKIVSNFFTYRTDKQRTKLLDLHNVVGIMSLPFTLMYALTGVVFNIKIIYQIVFVLVLYQGDQTQLLIDAGVADIEAAELTGRPQDMSSITALLELSEQTYGSKPTFIRIQNYGDETAVLQVIGKDKTHFAQRIETYYLIKDGSVLHQRDHNNNNVFEQGLRTINSLHFGNFAGIDLRILYFILAMAVAAMIAAGNLLWINKRAQQKNVSQRGLRFVGSLTLGGCSGFVVATAAAFLAERIMPVNLENRADLLVSSYVLTLVAVVIGGFYASNAKLFLRNMLNATAALLIVTLSADIIMFGDTLPTLWQFGMKSVIGVEVGLLLFAIMCFWIARLLRVDPLKTANAELNNIAVNETAALNS